MASARSGDATLLVGCLNGEAQARLTWEKSVGFGRVGVSYRLNGGPVVPRFALVSQDGRTLYPWTGEGIGCNGAGAVIGSDWGPSGEAVTFARHDDLAVDDDGAGADLVGVGGDLAEALGPVVAAPGEDLDRTVDDVEPGAALPARDPLDHLGEKRLDEAGIRRPRPGSSFDTRRESIVRGTIMDVAAGLVAGRQAPVIAVSARGRGVPPCRPCPELLRLGSPIARRMHALDRHLLPSAHRD